MSAGIKVRLDMTDPHKTELRLRINRNGKAQKFFTHEVRRMADPYVPKKEGILKGSAQESTNSITYIQPYSSKNYYSNRGMGKQGTAKGGKRGKLWDKRMWADHGDEVVASVANYVGGRAKK